jgi:hypothetical protein
MPVFLIVVLARAIGAQPGEVARVRKELEAMYQQNTTAFERYDVAAIMNLRAPDFHTITPDGAVRDRAAMAE